MADMRSFQTVVKLFTTYYYKYKDFRAVVETADDYKYADVYTVRQMLKSLKILDDYTDEVTYDEQQLMNVMDYVINNEQD